jgi:hypothetical protein
VNSPGSTLRAAAVSEHSVDSNRGMRVAWQVGARDEDPTLIGRLASTNERHFSSMICLFVKALTEL